MHFHCVSIQIELQVNIDIRNVPVPKMPLKLTSRKATAEGRLFAHCENSYFKPKVYPKTNTKF